MSVGDRAPVHPFLDTGNHVAIWDAGRQDQCSKAKVVIRRVAFNPLQDAVPSGPQIVPHKTEVHDDPAARPTTIPRSLPIPETHLLVPFQRGPVGSACRDRLIMLPAPLPLLPLA
ncbi:MULTISPECIES: hypothetical protein [Sphingobium]|jgi:hypothetical protein|uniref:hypothetical protein n=1 Tax=Sphingobium TaxID=165695 RepID=UPI0015F64EF1|nr:MULTISPECIES: hypothetical protein [Sphingobium]MDV3481966.1 hypothetical protein [Sphingobium yanoikuyae]HUD91746.1 hypothetical protein [Sphingobium sp.]